MSRGLTLLVAAAVTLLVACGFDLPEPSGSPPPAAEMPTRPTFSSARTRCTESRLAPAALRRLTRSELENTVRDVFPGIAEVWSGSALGPDPLSLLQFSNDENTLLVGEQTARELLTTAKQVAALVTDADHLGTILPCAASAADDACARQFITTYAPRLYRRSVSSFEHDELMSYYRSVSASSDFERGLKWSLVAMLQSPEFLYRSELGDASGRLDQFELASQLSYTYGGSTPSPELLAKAQRGELGTSVALRTEAEALLATPRGREQLLRFFREWTGYERVLAVEKADVKSFAAAMAPLLVEETRRFIEAVVIDGNGRLSDLLTGSTTYLNPDLAAFYGYGEPQRDFTAIERPAGRGIGLLAQASLLAGRSHFDFTSPVFRGLFVYQGLLCREPQVRPMGVPSIQDTSAGGTTRQRYEALHAQAPCAPCHQQFEPFGYALEHFDATGRYRETELGLPLDTHAQLALDDGTQLEFDGLEDLAAQLAALPDVSDCVSGLLANYVFAGAGGQVCLDEPARAQLAQGTLSLRDYYLSLANAETFSRRMR